MEEKTALEFLAKKLGVNIEDINEFPDGDLFMVGDSSYRVGNDLDGNFVVIVES